MPSPQYNHLNGRLVAAARVLAGIGAKQFAAEAQITTRTLSRLENDQAVQISQSRRHGCTSQ
jgi:transcriptional regulator with XRE-family HTH domain